MRLKGGWREGKEKKREGEREEKRRQRGREGGRERMTAFCFGLVRSEVTLHSF